MAGDILNEENAVRIRTELIKATRTAAELTHALGVRATEGFEPLMALERANYDANVASTRRDDQDVARVKTFLDALPVARKDRHNYSVFSFDTPAAAKVAESQIWQLPRRDDQLAYLIGQKMVEGNLGHDEVVDVLFAAKTEDDWAFSSLQTMLAMRNRLDELTQEKLAEPINAETISKYLTDDRRGYQLKYPDPKRLLRVKEDIVGLMRSPRKGIFHRTFNRERADKQLQKHGLRAHPNYDFKLNSTEIINYNLDIVCFKLATIFGIENVFQDTFGKLSTAGISGLAVEAGRVPTDKPNS